MSDAAKRRARTEPATEPPPAERVSEGLEVPSGCPVAWCPVCLAVSALQPIRPEAVEHLLRAGSELFLALRAVVDARADEVKGAKRGSGGGLEKIEVG